MKNEKLRYGLIGAGSNAIKKHLSNYLLIPNVELIAVCDVNIEQAKAVAEQYGADSFYQNYEEMIKLEKLDFVSVCTPNSLHADIAVYALEHGVHVHCEKPLAINGAEAQRIVHAKNRAKKKVMVGLNNRFTNEAVYLKKFIDAGHLGEIYKARAGWIRRSGIPGRGTWFTNKQVAGGGVMIDLGVHYLDLALFLMGMPNPSYVSGAIHHHFNQTTTRNRNGYQGNPKGIFNVEDSASGFIGLERGATIHFDFSWASNIEEDQTFIELAGSKGGATIINGELKIYSEVLDTCVDILPKLPTSHKLMNEFEHFISAIKKQGDLMAPAEHGAYMMNIVDHFYESAAKQQPIFFKENKSQFKVASSTYG
ncbi:Gfo/Idh/MocA family oxidoreductase [Bacillus sp. 1780r2a1]|nr:Gfo/Idh/MocA family oxidoreductase [Priestia flexa]USY56542.1 Gfo/Idh/MocA family oxidoreductase [Bacillus sp. 1780r2a1]